MARTNACAGQCLLAALICCRRRQAPRPCRPLDRACAGGADDDALLCPCCLQLASAGMSATAMGRRSTRHLLARELAQPAAQTLLTLACLTGMSSSLLLSLSICNGAMSTSTPRVTAPTPHLRNSDPSLHITCRIAAPPPLRRRPCPRPRLPQRHAACPPCAANGEGRRRVLEDRRRRCSSHVQCAVGGREEQRRCASRRCALIQQVLHQGAVARVQGSSVLLSACDV